MKTKKINFNFILKYFALFFLFLVLANAKFNNLSPFVYALFFACIYVGLDEKLTAIFTVVSAVLVDLKLETFFVALTVVGVGLIIFYIHKLIKKKIHLITIFLGFILSLITYFYYNFNNFENIIYFLILALISLFIFIVVNQVMLLRKNCFKLTLDESICFLFTIALIGLGLAPINLFNFSIYRVILMLIIFIFISIGNPTLTFAVTLSFSFGVGLFQMSLLPVAEFAILALLAGVFSMPHKVKICIITILGDILVQYLFLQQNVIQILYELSPIVLAGLIFIILPNKLLNSLSDIVYVKKSEMSSRNLINTTRKNIKKRLSELSNVFLDMKQIHLNMVKRELNKDELIAMLTREITSSCCRDCLDKNKCTRSLGLDNKSNIELLVEIAATKGKVTLLDIPSGLTNRCGKLNYLISTINRLCEEYRQYKSMMADVNNVKILLADQMGAVSNLLLNLGQEIDSNVTFDMARENKIISRLLSLNVECKEVLLYNEKNNDLSCVLVTKANAVNPVIEKVLTETLKCPMQITNITPMDEGDYNSITLHKRNKYDCIFGLAACNKSGNEESGDCHSIIRLGGNKFLLALCDGMGAGKSAHNMSALTLGLIENFYKVGFDNDVILESVNKLLAVNNGENYSTLDVCLIDLDKQLADFVKVGSPFGLIKRDAGIEPVEGGALPIGALDNITPATHKTTISTKDMIIMFTDGITDAFETEENLIEYISKLVSTNPQTIAESILNEALTRNGMSAKDDMSVLVARTYLKS